MAKREVVSPPTLARKQVDRTARTEPSLAGTLSLQQGVFLPGQAKLLARKKAESSHGPTVKRLKQFDGRIAADHALAELAAAHGQFDIVQDLPYFLEKPGLMRRKPQVLLLEDASSVNRSETALRGALLLQEFRPFGAPTGAYAVSDRSGRSVVLGAPEDRLEVALRGCQHLVRSRARMVLLTIQGTASYDVASRVLCSAESPRMDWAIRTRATPSFLKLGPTLDATYAAMGQKTRSNMRYYRRRAEQELRCRFLPEVTLSERELVDFNAESMFPQPKQAVRHRLHMQRQLRNPFLMGLQDGDGRWLSIVAGRRFDKSAEILWQMNRDKLPKHSMVSAMRSYVMEHEIARGTERLYIEGGTPHSMQNSFETEEVTDVVFIRPRLRAAVRRFVQKHVPPDNILAEMLVDPNTLWHSC